MKRQVSFILIYFRIFKYVLNDFPIIYMLYLHFLFSTVEYFLIVSRQYAQGGFS